MDISAFRHLEAAYPLNGLRKKLEVIEGEEDSFWKLKAGGWGVQDHADIEWGYERESGES